MGYVKGVRLDHEGDSEAPLSWMLADESSSGLKTML